MTSLIKGLRLSRNLLIGRDLSVSIRWVSPTKKVLGAFRQFDSVHIRFVAVGTNLTQPITYSLQIGSLPAGLTLDPSGLLYGGLAESQGQPIFTIRASSSGAFADHDFQMVIGDHPAPEWITPAGIIDFAGVDQPVTANTNLLAIDPFGFDVEYFIIGGVFPPGVFLDANTGAITGTYPDLPSDMEYDFTVAASNGDSFTPRDFIIYVSAQVPANAAVWVTPAGSIGSGYELSFFTSTLLAVDPNQLPISYVRLAGNIPQGTILDANSGILSGTFTAQPNDTEFKFIGGARTSIYTTPRLFTVTVLHDLQPAFGAVGNSGILGRVIEGNPFTANIAIVSNPDLPRIFTASGLANGIVLNADNGVVSSASMPPFPINNPGTILPIHFSVTFSDTIKSVTQSFEIDELKDVQPRWVFTGNSIGATFGSTPFDTGPNPIATDIWTRPVVFTLDPSTPLPPSLSFDPNLGRISGIMPDAVDADVVIPLTITATAGPLAPISTHNGANAAVKTWTLTSWFNAPPVWDTNAGLIGSMIENTASTLSVHAHDAHNVQTVTYRVITSDPPVPGLELDALSGQLVGNAAFIPDPDFDTYNFTVEASYNGILPTTRDFSVTVTKDYAPVWDTPQGEIIRVFGGQNFTVSAHGHDPSGTPVTYGMISNNLPNTVTFSSNANGVTFNGYFPDTFVQNVSYFANIEINKTVGGLQSAEQTFVLTSLINLTPVWITQAGVIADQLEQSNVAVTLSAYDPEGNAITYFITIPNNNIISGAGYLVAMDSNGVITGKLPPVSHDTEYDFTAYAWDKTNVLPGPNRIYATPRTFTIMSRFNSPPVWVTPPIINTLESSPFSLVLSATGNGNANSMTYSMIDGSLPPGITFDAPSGTLSGNTPSESIDYTYTFTMRADNGTKFTDQQFTFNVFRDVAPVWANAAGLFAQHLGKTALNYILLATSNEPVTPPPQLIYSIIDYGNVPASMHFSFDNGVVITGSLPLGDTDTLYEFTAQVTDNISPPVPRTFSILDLANEPPVWITNAGSLGASIIEGTPVNFTLHAADPEGNAVVYTFANGTNIPGVNLSNTGALTGNAPAVANGSQDFNLTVSASDGRLNSLRDFFFTVNHNYPPVWQTPSGNIGTVLGGYAPVTNLIATDPNGTPVGLSVTGGALPPGLSVANTGFVGAVDPNLNAAHEYDFTVTATDGVNNVPRDFSIFAIPNLPPVFTPPTDTLLSTQFELTVFTANVSVVDPNGGTIVFQQMTFDSRLGTSLTFNQATGIITGTLPQILGDTVYDIFYLANNGIKQATAHYTVKSVFDTPPVFVDNPHLPDGLEGHPYPRNNAIVQCNAVSNGATVFYSVTGGSLPPGITLAVDGTISGTAPLVANNQTFSFVVTATTGIKASTQTYFLTIKQNLPPVWVTNSALNVLENTFASFTLVAIDPNDEPLTYSLDNGTVPSPLQFSANGGANGAALIYGNVAALPYGSNDLVYDLTVGANNGFIKTDQTFVLTLKYNQPPIWANVGLIDRQYEDTPISLQVQATDPEGQPVHYFMNTTTQAWPPWLSLDSNTGALSGTLPAVGFGVEWTSWMFNIDASDGYRSNTGSFIIEALFDTQYTDPYSNAVGLLMNFDNGVVDLLGHTITAPFGNLPTIDTSTFVFGSASARFLSSSFNMFAIPSDTDTSLNTQFTGPLTIEFWVKPSSLTANGIIFWSETDNNGNTEEKVTVTQSLNKIIFTTNSFGNTPQTKTFTMPSASFYHVALVNVGGGPVTWGFHCYVNGNLLGFISTLTQYPFFPSPTYIGCGWTGNPPFFDGWIDDLRITGAARYTSNFLPSYAPVPPVWNTAANAIIAVTQEREVFNGVVNAVVLDIHADPAQIAYIVVNSTISDLSVDTSGDVTGTMPVSGSPTTFYLTAEDTNGNFSQFRQFQVTSISNAPAWVTNAGNILTQNENTSVSFTFEATSATSYEIANGALPDGIILDSNTGILSGTLPFVTANTISNFTVSAINISNSITRDFSITDINVRAVPIWITGAGSILSQNENTVVNTSVVAGDSQSRPITYSLTGGSFPSGITMDSSGNISGTLPFISANTTTNFTISATNEDGSTPRTFSITDVNVPVLPVWTTNAGNILTQNENTAVSATVVATDAQSRSVTYSVTSGSLPSGVSLSSNGTISGTLPFVTANTISNFTVSAHNEDGSVPLALSITDINVPVLPTWFTPTGNLVTQNEHTSVNTVVVATDVQNRTITYSIVTGTLPSGVILHTNGAITGTLPYVTSNTVYNFEIAAANEDGNVPLDFSITDNNVPAPPTWSTPAGVIVTQNEANTISVGVVAIDSQGRQITYTLANSTTLPGTLVLSNTGVISGTLPRVQSDTTYNFDVQATNEDGSIFRTFGISVVNVPLAPTWSTPAGLLVTANENASISNTVVATDIDGLTVTYALVSGAFPSGVTLDANSGLISGTLPFISSNTTYNFTISATTTDGSVNRAFSIDSVNVPALPVWITSTGTILTQNENTVVNTSVLASDSPQNRTITYSLQNSTHLPTGLTLASNGVITGTLPLADGNQTYTFTIGATNPDGTTGRDFAIQSVNVPVLAVWNTAAGTLVTQNEGTAISTSVSATDPQSRSVTYALANSTTLPSGIALYSNGVISGSTRVQANTGFNFDVSAINEDGANGRTFGITIINVPQAPTWSTPAGSLTTQNEGNAVSIFLSASDIDGLAVTYSLANSTSLPSSLTLSSAGHISGTLAHVSNNTTTSFDVTATTNDGSANRSFSITVVHVPSPPVWSTASGNILTQDENTAYSVTVSASDIESQTTTYSLFSGTLPTGASLDANAGTISGTLPYVTANTNFSFVLTATNLDGSTNRSFSILDVDVPQFPTIVTAGGLLATQDENTFVNTVVVATDPQGRPLTYSISSGALPSGVTLNSSNGAIMGTLPFVSSDTTYSFVVQVDNEDGHVGKSFSIKDLNVLQPPVWSTNAGVILTQNEYSSVSTAVVATDIPQNRTITYSVVSGSLPSGVTMDSSGNISGALPGITANTAYNFTVRATNADGHTDQAFEIDSVNVPSPPTWFTANGVIATQNEHTAISVNVVATDAHSRPITYALANSTTLPSGVSLGNTTGLISGTLPYIMSNTAYHFSVAATNEDGTVYQSFEIDSIYVPTAPIWTTASGNILTQNENTVVSTDLVASDVHSLTITYTLANGTTLPSGLSLSNAGHISGTLPLVPGSNVVTNFNVSASTTDGSTIRSFSITDVNVPVLPVWTTNAGNIITQNETSTVSFTLVATDAQSRSITYSLANSTTLPSGVTLNSNGLISGTLPFVSSNTTTSIDVSATNEDGSTNRTFTIIDNNIPILPVWTTDSGILLTQNETTVVNTVVVATDAGSRTITYTIVDPTTLLFHMEDSVVGNTVGDSAYGTNLTLNGLGSLSTAQKKFGAQAYFCNTVTLSPSNVTKSAPNPYGVTFGTGDFTVEAFVYPTSVTSVSGGGFASPICNVIQTGETDGAEWAFFVADSTGAGTIITRLYFAMRSGSGTFFCYGSPTTGSTSSIMSMNAWHHVAYTRAAGVVSFYVDGTQLATVTTESGSPGTQNMAVTAGSTFNLGGYTGSTQLGGNSFAGTWQGYIDEVRISNGVARYTGSSYTVPIAAFSNSALLPIGVTLASNGAITGTLPSVSANTTTTFSINATNVDGSNARSFSIVDLNFNHPPTWVTTSGALANSPVNEGSFFTYTLAGSDVDVGDTLTYTLANGNSVPAGLTLLSNGLIYGTAAGVTSNTTTTFTVNLSDGIANVANTFSITVNDTPPIWSNSAGSIGSFNENSSVTYKFYAADSAGTGATSYVANTALPSGLTLNSNGTITGNSPVVATANTVTFFTVYANNATYSAPRNFNITILKVAPVWVSAGSLLSIYDGNAVSIQLVATDTQSITYSLANSTTLPGGLALASNGLISGTANAISADTTYNFSVGASDGVYTTYQSNLTITILSSSNATASANTSLLLHMEGLNGSNSFVDSSKSTYTVVNTGNVVVSTSIFKVGNASAHFIGNGALTVANAANLDFGTGDFTIEMWANPSVNADSHYTLSKSAAAGFGPWAIKAMPATTGQWTLQSSGTGTSYGSIANGQMGPVTLNSWQHVAASRINGVWRMFVNGVQGNPANMYVPGGNVVVTSSSVFIGGYGAGSYWNGYIDEVKLTKGVGLYTTTNPAPAEVTTSLFHMEDTISANTMTDSSQYGNNLTFHFGTGTLSNAQAKFGTQSFSSNGTAVTATTTVSRTVTNMNTVAFGMADLTIEGFVYLTALTNAGSGSFSGVICNLCAPGASTDVEWTLTVWGTSTTNPTKLFFASRPAGSSSPQFFVRGAAPNGTDPIITLNAWHHMAVSRTNGQCYFFVDGVQIPTTIESGTPVVNLIPPANSVLAVGGYPATGYGGGNWFSGQWQGYLDEIRITNGYAYYTSNFTVTASAFSSNSGITASVGPVGAGLSQFTPPTS